MAKLKPITSKVKDPTALKEGGHPVKDIVGHEDRLLKIDINLIQPDPDQPRKSFDPKALAELSESIKSKGVIQPILVRVDKENSDKCWIIAGERRYRASKMAGLKTIPAIIKQDDPAELALIENIQREDLNPIEEAEGYKRLMETHGYNQETLGSVVNKPQSKISEILSINSLPEEVKEDCRESNLSKSLLIELVKQPQEKLPKLYQQAKAGTLTVAKLRKKKTEARGRKKSTPEELAFKKLQDFDKSIKKIEKNNLTKEDKEELWEKFNDVYKYLNALCN